MSKKKTTNRRWTRKGVIYDIQKPSLPKLIIVFFFVMLFGLTLSAGASANNTDHFYGLRSLKPMVQADGVMVYLPSQGGFVIENGETKYDLTDHLHSPRLSVKTDNTTSELMGYTPFGDIPSTGNTSSVGRYTGMLFEPETDTYDYHARFYDPSQSRFLSVDTIRESISPYSYTENDPINHIDPSGLGRVYFWLYSFGDSLDATTKAEYVERVKVQMMSHSGPGDQFIPVDLDTIDFNPSIFGSKHIDNITITFAKGSVFNNDGALTPLLTLFEKSTIDSIFLPNCTSGCENGASKSPAMEFALLAKERFPGLKYIITSPYDVSTYLSQSRPDFINLDLHTALGKLKTEATLAVPTSKFFSGDFEPRFYERPKSFMVKNVQHEFDGTISKFETPAEIHDKLGKFFEEPVFSRLLEQSVSPKPKQMAAGGTTYNPTQEEVGMAKLVPRRQRITKPAGSAPGVEEHLTAYFFEWNKWFQ